MFNPFLEQAKTNSLSGKKDSIEQRKKHTKEDWVRFRSFNVKIKTDLESKQGCICSYCGNDYSLTSTGQIDHFLPKSLFPQFLYTPENLILSCQKCNSQFKATKNPWKTHDSTVFDYPSTKEFSIVHPILDNPNDHFEISEGSLIVKLLTTKARESNSLFHLNIESALCRRARIEIESKYSCLSDEKKNLVEIIASKPRSLGGRRLG